MWRNSIAVIMCRMVLSQRILNATHVGLTVDTLWYYLVKNFDNRQVLDFAYW